MPSANFLSHRERKHSMIENVPYVKLSNDQQRKDSAMDVGPLVKCRFCPNRIPNTAMARHLERCHIECHLCGRTLLKSNRAKHMAQKHGESNRNDNDDGSNLPDLAVLSQSKSSLLSEFSDGSIPPSIDDLASGFSYSTVTKMPYQSNTLSSSSSLSATPSPPPPQQSLVSTPTVTNPMAQEPDTIHVDIWQLHRYIQQRRVYTSNGCLYLRNSMNSM